MGHRGHSKRPRNRNDRPFRERTAPPPVALTVVSRGVTAPRYQVSVPRCNETLARGVVVADARRAPPMTSVPAHPA